MESGNESAGEEKVTDASSQEVVTKYKLAGDLANEVCAAVLARCKPGARIVELCDYGDRLIEEKVAGFYKKGSVPKGIAFPTCVSVNEVAGHVSPFADDQTLLEDGDVVKVDLGVHVDGFAAVVAHTIVLGDTTGRKADVIHAAYTAAEAAVRLMRIGNTNTQLTDIFEKAVKPFQCTMLEGVLSHEMKQFVLNADGCIIGNQTAERNVEEMKFEAFQVFGIDVVVSTGDGRAVDREGLCTVYQRAVDTNYQLKMKASRALLSQINKQFPTFPFTLRALDSQKARLGVTECLQHELIQPYPVLSAKKGDFVAHFKFTVILQPSGTLKITGLPVDLAAMPSEHRVEDPELLQLLAQPAVNRKRKRKKGKKKKKQASSGQGQGQGQQQ